MQREIRRHQRGRTCWFVSQAKDVAKTGPKPIEVRRFGEDCLVAEERFQLVQFAGCPISRLVCEKWGPCADILPTLSLRPALTLGNG
jgi:hypothetical protein